MKLYLIRHGEAASNSREPQLTAKAQTHIQHLAKTLRTNGTNVSQIYHSGKQRALQTAEILASHLQPTPSIAMLEGLSPNDLPHSLLPTIQQWQQPTMLVGHLPFMTSLTALLLTGYEDGLAINFEPGTLICLQKEAQHWVLDWMLGTVFFS